MSKHLAEKRWMENIACAREVMANPVPGGIINRRLLI